MLSLWKLRVGAESYYLAQVARGLDDYYTGNGEVAGVWAGHAAPGMGLAGEVTGEDLRALLAGLRPGTGLTANGERLRPNRRRVPGFDLTFSVPKSVSVLWALGDPRVQHDVVESGEAAVAGALGWLEREACHVRRGSNNRSAKAVSVEAWGTRRLPGAGFVAARFRHRVSRAGDPQLHWHVLVANVTCGPDGRWSALDATGLYRSKRAAGVVFQAALRAELTRRLGVEWLPACNDAAEVAGVPGRVVRLFSKRREQIEAELARLGGSGPVAAAAATLATRTPGTGSTWRGSNVPGTIRPSRWAGGPTRSNGCCPPTEDSSVNRASMRSSPRSRRGWSAPTARSPAIRSPPSSRPTCPPVPLPQGWTS
jgi:conjugative relaxase-like TrwC/TraI family protein